MKAATKGHKDVVRVLLEHGADVNISSTEVKPDASWKELAKSFGNLFGVNSENAKMFLFCNKATNIQMVGCWVLKTL